MQYAAMGPTHPATPPSLCSALATQRGVPHAYISCSRSLKLRGLLSSVVAQLTHGGKRKRAAAYAAAPGSESALAWELKGAATQRALSLHPLCPWLLHTSDAADETSGVDLGCRSNTQNTKTTLTHSLHQAHPTTPKN